jgi:hypothetical protein
VCLFFMWLQYHSKYLVLVCGYAQEASITFAIFFAFAAGLHGGSLRGALDTLPVGV